MHEKRQMKCLLKTYVRCYRKICGWIKRSNHFIFWIYCKIRVFWISQKHTKKDIKLWCCWCRDGRFSFYLSYCKNCYQSKFIILWLVIKQNHDATMHALTSSHIHIYAYIWICVLANEANQFVFICRNK